MLFKGKPIMARIKAKPLQRIPLTPNVSGVQLKNGYRATPPPTTAAVFDPAAFTQRFVYPAGAAIPASTVPAAQFSGQVQFIVSNDLFNLLLIVLVFIKT